MRFSILNKKQGLSLCLAALLAMSLFLCAAVPVRAEGETTEATTEATAEATTEATESTEAVGEGNPVVVPEAGSFEEAKAALLAVLDSESPEAQAIQALPAEDPYLREDFVAAMGKCTGAISQVNDLDLLLEQLEEKLPILPGELQGEYQDTLAKERSALSFAPVTELMEAATADPSAPIFLYKTSAFQQEAEALSQKAQQLGDALDGYPYLAQTFDGETGNLAAPKDWTMEAAAQSRLDELTSCRDSLKAQVEDFFSLSAADQASLASRIDQLQADTAAFLLTLTYGRRICAQVEKVSDKLGTVTLLTIIGLAVAVVAFGLAIGALVAAIRAPSRMPKVDLSGTASKEDVRSLRETFDREMNEMDQKAQQYQANGLGEMDARLKRLESGSRPAPDVPPMPNPPVPPVPPVPPTPPAPQRKPIGFLRLDYQNIAPDLSSLRLDDGGSLILYDDMTVDLRPEQQKKANDMKSWQDQGLMYLFDPRLDSGAYGFSDGYYMIDQVERPAQVTSLGNSYKLMRKGCIKMKRIG